MPILREISSKFKYISSQFRSIVLTGPRQSGKTTLARNTYPNKPYVSLENIDIRLFAETDPRGFLNRYSTGAIIDEVQRVPIILNYLQEILDNTEEDGLFILTGSNNLLLQDSISQSLAGRVGYLELLPLSTSEIYEFPNRQTLSNQNLIFHGGYPEIYQSERDPKVWYDAYIRTYLERDVRQITQIEDLKLFQRFLSICAGRVGQEVNYQSIATQVGVDQRTLKKWISVAETSYIIYLLPPYYKNFNKRLVKSPKLYFYDVGVATRLLGLRTDDELDISSFYGSLFENLVISEFLKLKANFDLDLDFYFWRDNHGIEVDLLIDYGSEQLPIEIKASMTYRPTFDKNLKKFRSYSGIEKSLIIYGGDFEVADDSDQQLWNLQRISPERLEAIMQNRKG